jgi:hypothetical protein
MLIIDWGVIKIFHAYPKTGMIFAKSNLMLIHIFNAETSEEAMAQGVVNRLVSKIEGLFQYLDHDIPKTSNQAEHEFSLFQPIIDAGKSFSTGVGNFFRTLMFYKNFHYYSSDRTNM